MTDAEICWLMNFFPTFLLTALRGCDELQYINRGDDAIRNADAPMAPSRLHIRAPLAMTFVRTSSFVCYANSEREQGLVDLLPAMDAAVWAHDEALKRYLARNAA